MVSLVLMSAAPTVQIEQEYGKTDIQQLYRGKP